MAQVGPDDWWIGTNLPLSALIDPDWSSMGQIAYRLASLGPNWAHFGLIGQTLIYSILLELALIETDGL